jgi:DNA-binding transcriptional regulator YiaG/DNA-binding PadR family transcriptional regulator
VTSIRIIDMLAEPLRSRSRVPAREPCSVAGCSVATTFGKPYCEEHIDRIAYVREARGRIEARGAEIDLAERGRCPASGCLTRDVLVSLSLLGARTPKRIAIDVEIPSGAASSCLKTLEKAGLLQVLTVGSRRGTPRKVVMLTEVGKKTVGRIMTAMMCSKCGASCLPSSTRLCRGCRGLEPLGLDEPFEDSPEPVVRDHVTCQSQKSEPEGKIEPVIGGRNMAGVSVTRGPVQAKAKAFAKELNEACSKLEKAADAIAAAITVARTLASVMGSVEAVNGTGHGPKAKTPKKAAAATAKKEPPVVKAGGSFSAWLKKVRAAAELSQPEFGENVGASRTQIWHWEKGGMAPGESALKRIETFAKETCPAR